MTMPALPRQEYPDIERLREALAEDTKWAGLNGGARQRVVSAARSLIATFDAQVAAQEAATRQAAASTMHRMMADCACGGEHPVAGWWHSKARCYATGGPVAR